MAPDLCRKLYMCLCLCTDCLRSKQTIHHPGVRSLFAARTLSKLGRVYTESRCSACSLCLFLCLFIIVIKDSILVSGNVLLNNPNSKVIVNCLEHKRRRLLLLQAFVFFSRDSTVL